MYEDPGDYTGLRTDSNLVFITGDNHRACIDINIIDDPLLEGAEIFSVQVVPGPGGLPPQIQLDPVLTFVVIQDNDCKCPVLLFSLPRYFCLSFYLHILAEE